MFDFIYILNKDGSEYVRALYSNQPNPQYWLCGRFFTAQAPYYRNFDVQPFEEIVTVDEGLTQVIECLDSESAETYEIADNQQILCVFCLLDVLGNEVDGFDVVQKKMSGFEFCGFDLSDGSTSALTNCQGGFDKAFSYKDLNELGIVSDYFKAKSIQKKLFDEYDEDHTDCVLFAIFRKTNK